MDLQNRGIIPMDEEYQHTYYGYGIQIDEYCRIREEEDNRPWQKLAIGHFKYEMNLYMKALWCMIEVNPHPNEWRNDRLFEFTMPKYEYRYLMKQLTHYVVEEHKRRRSHGVSTITALRYDPAECVYIKAFYDMICDTQT
jgi:predicted metal-binding transcription factor (methanogenesis marker protein 9)